MRRMLVVMSALSSLACVEPNRSARDGALDVPDCTADAGEALCDEASRDNAMFTWARAVCGLLLDCCTAPERSRAAELLFGEQGLALLTLSEPAWLEDATQCRRAVALSLFTRYQHHFEALDDHRQRFNLEEARACLAWAQAGALHCAPGLVFLSGDDEPRACRHMFAPNVEADGGCYDDADCVAAPDGGRSVCETHTARLGDGGIRFSLTGSCRPLPKPGEYCPLPDSDCGTGGYCAADNTCRARLGLDQVCLAAPCDTQTYCDTSRQPPACSQRKGNYEPCASTSQCVSGASCVEGLEVCLEQPSLSPLDVRFDFCLGSQDNGVARQLPFVPPEGGL